MSIVLRRVIGILILAGLSALFVVFLNKVCVLGYSFLFFIFLYLTVGTATLIAFICVIYTAGILWLVVLLWYCLMLLVFYVGYYLKKYIRSI